MNLEHLALYLGSAAASDDPINDREKDYIRHLLRDFGATLDQSMQLVAALPAVFPPQAPLPEVDSRDQAMRVVRALLVISYSDGCFDQEEFAFLVPWVDRFSFTSSELNNLKQQATYYLRLPPPAIVLDPHLLASLDWTKVESASRMQFRKLMQDLEKQLRANLDAADAVTCFLALTLGPPTFDPKDAEERFVQTQPDYLSMSPEEGLAYLRDHTLGFLLKQYQAAYLEACSNCQLQAPGRRRDVCPRCQNEYGQAPARS